jgi:hypothetical protein
MPYTKAPVSEKELDEIIDESQLYRHLKSKPIKLKKPNKNKNNLKIATQDFQLYQAIKLLHGLVAMND